MKLCLVNKLRNFEWFWWLDSLCGIFDSFPIGGKWL